MEPGRVIEFIEGRGFISAVVTRVKTGKVSVLTETDREMSIGQSRVMHETAPGLNPTLSRDELAKRLREISARRAALSEQVALEELWELLEGEGEEFAYNDLTDLAFSGEAGPDQQAAVIRAVFADGLYFKLRPQGAERHSAEQVEAILGNRRREEEREQEATEAVDFLTEIWKGGTPDPPPIKDRLTSVLFDMALNGPSAPEYKWGSKLLERAGLGSDPLRPLEVLIRTGDADLHENLDLLRERIAIGFSDEARREAESLAGDQCWRGQERQDLTHLDVITADSGGARDFDDAVSLEEKDGRLILGVHIADVSALILPGSALDREAMGRATSIYMPDRRIPMLPEILSDGCLSLKMDEVRPAFSLLAEMNESGEVLSHSFTPSLVKVKRQLSYQEVDAVVATDRLLSRMYKLSQKLKERRLAAGALIMPLPKLNVYLTPEGEIGLSLTYWENPGRSLISEFMIIANELAALDLIERNAAGIFRCQDPPSQRLFEGEADMADLMRCLQQRRYLSRVQWSLEPGPHSGMGLSAYTNLTSPLRRYIDLIIQRQIRSLLTGGEPMYSPEKMSELLTVVDEARKRAMRVQNSRQRYWLLRYFEAHAGQVHEALVLEKNMRKYRVFLTDIMMDADVPLRSGRTLTPGENVQVRVKKARAREEILQFEAV